MTMGCGYCGALYKDTQPHYCAQGRDFLVAENKRLREALVRCRAMRERGDATGGHACLHSALLLEVEKICGEVGE